MNISYEDKILGWNMKNFDELVSSMTDDEIDDMVWFLEKNDFFPMSADYNDRSEVVYDYMKRWLYTVIENGDKVASKALFEKVQAVA